MTESQERLVRAILERVPVARVVDVHVFPPLRQGPTETAVAVVAAHREGRDAHTVAEPNERHTVMTARYRLTLRGPDRGKWEFDLVEEADAPLVTVDAVVRGVQERAGEGGDPERLGPDALAAFAPATDGAGTWTTAPR